MSLPASSAASAILIVDADPAVRAHLSTLLSQAGHHPTVAEHATAAVEAAVRLSFDLVIADLELPGVDGVALIARLRSRDPEQEFLLPGRKPEAKIRAARAGVMDCLIKPLDGGDCWTRIENSRAPSRSARTGSTFSPTSISSGCKRGSSLT